MTTERKNLFCGAPLRVNRQHYLRQNIGHVIRDICQQFQYQRLEFHRVLSTAPKRHFWQALARLYNSDQIVEGADRCYRDLNFNLFAIVPED